MYERAFVEDYGQIDKASLPTVVVTSVIRSTYQGESHGGVYLLDLASGDRTQVLDWDNAGIDWSGRGGDRGLRGLAFWQDLVVLAASDEIFFYSHDFELVDSVRNSYLRHCHEIAIAGDQLYLTSCGFDSILQFDLTRWSFSAGFLVRSSGAAIAVRRTLSRLQSGEVPYVPKPRLRTFDPERSGGPQAGDTSHINSVSAVDGRICFSGTVVKGVYEIHDDVLRLYATIPLRTHNAQPYSDGVIYNDTAADRVAYADRKGNVFCSFEVPSFPEERLRNTQLAKGRARQAFARGLATWDDRYLLAGSSPATVTIHDLQTHETKASYNLAMDVRNAVHGLEVWPFGPTP